METTQHLDVAMSALLFRVSILLDLLAHDVSGLGEHWKGLWASLQDARLPPSGTPANAWLGDQHEKGIDGNRIVRCTLPPISFTPMS